MEAGAILDETLFRQRAAALEWLLFDVDGVLTDGRLVYGALGEAWKVFDVRDGLGLQLARRAGLKVGLLSGRRNEALASRAVELQLDAYLLGQGDKRAAFAAFLSHQQTAAERVAYLGDDLPDLPVLLHCGLSFAPADAAAEVRERVDRVLKAPGGRAAAREMVELVLSARGDWERLVAEFLA